MRKRVNLSLDLRSYRRLEELRVRYGYRTSCELVAAFVHILIDRLEEPSERRYDLPEDDGAYIDGMFEDLGHSQRQPDGTVPIRHHRKSLNDYGENKRLPKDDT